MSEFYKKNFEKQEPETLSPDLQNLLKFQTSIDLDKFMTLPVAQKMKLAEHLQMERLYQTLLYQNVDYDLIAKESLRAMNLTVDKFLEGHSGFWTQKYVRGCIHPSSTYQLIFACVQHQLLMFAEQKIGSAQNKVIKTEEDACCPEVEKNEEVSSVFKGFKIDIVSQSTDVKWESRKTKTLVGNKSQGSFGYGLCLLRGQDKVILF